MSDLPPLLSLRIWALSHSIEAHLAEALRPHGLTVASFRLVGELSQAPAGLRPSDLASRLGVSRPSVTNMVRRLKELGLLLTVPDPDDARATRVQLASDAPMDFGFSLLAQLDQRLLGDDPSQLPALLATFETLLARLNADEESAP